ncbi:hypothetical protein CY35_17G020200 [Sphagnum magellanicum]|nr:hypothetical protein CY35_17G020200 [Sphagnum magellanicum]
MDAETGQELRGFWSGLYGPYGVEMLTVSYTKNDIFVTKIIGDQNVPSRELTFYARLSTESSEVPMHFQSVLASVIIATHVSCQLEKVWRCCIPVQHL